MRTRHLPGLLGLAIALILALSACAPEAPPPPAAPAEPPAPADPAAKEDAVAEFYSGNTVRFIVGLSPGGGYDTYARAIARHIDKYIPGNPTVIVENMPGAGSMIATNHVYNAAPKDGTVIAHFLGGLITQQLFGVEGIEFDAAQFHFIGAPVGDTAVLHVHERTGLTSLVELIEPGAPELVVGGVGPGAMNVDAPILLREVLDANIRVVQGYPGSAEVRLAIDTEEVDGFFNAWESTKITSLDMIETGEWVNIVQLTDEPHADMPDVPTIPDVTETEEQAQMLRFGYAIPGQFARPFTMAPEVPEERVEAIQAAFLQTLQDPEFLADAEQGRLEINPLTGADLQMLIQDYLAMPADVQAELERILAPGS